MSLWAPAILLRMLCLLGIFGFCGAAPFEYPPEFGTYRLLIDPGHGGDNYGAEGLTAGDFEKHYNLEVALLLKERLENTGHFDVGITRTIDQDIDPYGRADIANDQHPDLFISIHFNWGDLPEKNGYSVILSENQHYDENFDFAQTLGGTLRLFGFLPDRMMGSVPEDAKPVQPHEIGKVRRYLMMDGDAGVYLDSTQYIALMRSLEVPGVLLEGGYLTNKTDYELLQFGGRRQMLVKAIEAAIFQHFYKRETDPAFATCGL